MLRVSGLVRQQVVGASNRQLLVLFHRALLITGFGRNVIVAGKRIHGGQVRDVVVKLSNI